MTSVQSIFVLFITLAQIISEYHTNDILSSQTPHNGCCLFDGMTFAKLSWLLVANESEKGAYFVQWEIDKNAS